MTQERTLLEGFDHQCYDQEELPHHWLEQQQIRPSWHWQMSIEL
jgi:hypothetical protein